MSDIDELEKYESQPVDMDMKHPKRSAHARKMGTKLGGAATLEKLRQSSVDGARFARSANHDRPQPSMPVVKWLLRPDPFEDKT